MLIDRGETPKQPYYIFIVKYRENLNKDPWEIGKAYSRRDDINFRPLNVAEAIALCIHTDVLCWYDVWCAGSYMGHRGGVVVPCITMKNNQPVLTIEPSFSDKEAVSPMCRY